MHHADCWRRDTARATLTGFLLLLRQLLAGGNAEINVVAAVHMNAELHAVMRLFQNQQLRHALEQRQHYAG